MCSHGEADGFWAIARASRGSLMAVGAIQLCKLKHKSRIDNSERIRKEPSVVVGFVSPGEALGDSLSLGV